MLSVNNEMEVDDAIMDSDYFLELLKLVFRLNMLPCVNGMLRISDVVRLEFSAAKFEIFVDFFFQMFQSGWDVDSFF